MKNKWQLAKEFTKWKEKLYANWHNVQIVSYDQTNKNGKLKVGDSFKLSAVVELGSLTPDDVEVQIYYGDLNIKDQPHANDFKPMQFIKQIDKTTQYYYEGEIECVTTGNFGFTLRILPKHELLINKFELGLIKWA